MEMISVVSFPMSLVGIVLLFIKDPMGTLIFPVFTLFFMWSVNEIVWSISENIARFFWAILYLGLIILLVSNWVPEIMTPGMILISMSSSYFFLFLLFILCYFFLGLSEIRKELR